MSKRASPVVLAAGLLLLAGQLGVCAGPTTKPLTVVLGAQTREIALLRGELAGRKEHRILGIRYWEGRLASRRTVVARMASGKVNAAMVTTLAIEHFKPSEVIVTGIAGALNPNLRPGDLVIARRTVHHDMFRIIGSDVEYRGARDPIRGGRIPVFLEPPGDLLELAQRAARRTRFIPVRFHDRPTSPRSVRVLTGVVATGDAFVASDAMRADLRERLGADAVEMEGAAVAQVCYHLDVPCIVIRCMSDLANDVAVDDLESFADIAANNSAHLVREILRLLAERDRALMGRSPSPGSPRTK